MVLLASFLNTIYNKEPWEDLTIGFNARYLLDVLQLIKDETVTLMLTDELSPGIIRPLEEQGFLAVVMPVRI